jgi:hypothetical protein
MHQKEDHPEAIAGGMGALPDLVAFCSADDVPKSAEFLSGLFKRKALIEVKNNEARLDKMRLSSDPSPVDRRRPRA